MSWRATVSAALVAAAVSSACAEDAELLYDRELPPQTGAGGEEPPPPLTGGGGGFGMRPTVGSGGEEPPPVFCEEPYCECPLGETCFCAVEPMTPEPCHLDCIDGFCTMGCNPDAFCTMECTEGCLLDCPPGGTCNVLCVEGGCTLHCAPNSYCFVEPSPGATFIECAEGAICECADPMSCICEGGGCADQMGP